MSLTSLFGTRTFDEGEGGAQNQGYAYPSPGLRAAFASHSANPNLASPVVGGAREPSEAVRHRTTIDYRDA